MGRQIVASVGAMQYIPASPYIPHHQKSATRNFKTGAAGWCKAEINACNLFYKVGSRRQPSHNADLFTEFDNVLK